MKMMKTLMLASALFVGVSTVQADSAQSLRLSEIVNYQDLDLSLSQDANSLYTRLRRAAKKVCVMPKSRDLTSRADFDTCASAAVANAVADINNPNLSQQHFARTGEHVPSVAVAAR